MFHTIVRWGVFTPRTVMKTQKHRWEEVVELRGYAGVVHPVNGRTNDNNFHRVLEQFQKMKPPVFVGEVDPLQAEGWLLQIEKILDVMNCTDE